MLDVLRDELLRPHSSVGVSLKMEMETTNEGLHIQIVVCDSCLLDVFLQWNEHWRYASFAFGCPRFDLFMDCFCGCRRCLCWWRRHNGSRLRNESHFNVWCCIVDVIVVVDVVVVIEMCVWRRCHQLSILNQHASLGL